MLEMLAFGFFGLIVGSFLNVLMFRHGHKSLRGRSECMACHRKIAWYDNIPVISWVLLGARCRSCREVISVQYPLVELSSAILFSLIGYAYIRAPHIADFEIFTLLFPYLAIGALLLAIAVYDLRTTIIPDAWVWWFNALALLPLFLAPPYAGLHSGYALLAGPFAALPLFALWFLSGGRWMGFGDVKLALGIGWLLGPYHGPLAIFLAFILGGIASVPLLLFSSTMWQRISVQLNFSKWGKVSSKSGAGYTMKSEIPFGPFLVASCFIIWFAQMYNVQLPFFAIYGL